MYEFTSHHLLRDEQLETTLRAAFDRVAEAPNAAPATAGIIHSDGGRRTFTATFESFEDARAFRTDIAGDPDADAHVSPRLEDLEHAAPERIELEWAEPAPGVQAPG